MKLLKIYPLLLLLSVCLHGENLIKNPNFTAWGTTSPSSWTDRSKQVYQQLSGGGGLEVEIIKSKGSFGEILQKIQTEPGRKYRLSGEVRGSSSGLSLLQVKRYGGGSEINRISTKRNAGEDWLAVELTFDTEGVEYIEVLLRWRQQSENLGSVAGFRKLSLEALPVSY